MAFMTSESTEGDTMVPQRLLRAPEREREREKESERERAPAVRDYSRPVHTEVLDYYRKTDELSP